MIELIHGGDWAGYQEEYGVQPLDFSANISPLGIPEGVKRAVIKALDGADRYPDPLCRALRGELAEEHCLEPQNILCGNGAADLIDRLVLAKQPKSALVTAPTFAEYERALTTAGCKVKQFILRKETGFAITEELLESIVPGLDLLFLCEPNNPTGRTTQRDLLIRILERCAVCGTFLVVDECFNEFLDDPSAHTLKEKISRYPNLLILKAFTKWYAMAGIRLGYALCGDSVLLEKMRLCGQPWAVSTLAQAAGMAALEEKEYGAELRKIITVQRPRLKQELSDMGCNVCPGEANYLLFFCRDFELTQKLRTRGILLRGCENYAGLGAGWYRAAVRTERENTVFLQAVREAL